MGSAEKWHGHLAHDVKVFIITGGTPVPRRKPVGDRFYMGSAEKWHGHLSHGVEVFKITGGTLVPPSEPPSRPLA